MKPLLPLSPAARYVLELGSQVAPPTAEQNERMDRALGPLLDPNLSPAPTDGSASLAPNPGGASRALSRTGRMLLGSSSGKLLLLASAAAATTLASFWLGRMSTQLEAPRASPALAARATPPPLPAEPASALALAEPASLPTEPAPAFTPPNALFPARDGPTQPPARSSARSLGLAADIERLSRADAALRQDRPGHALQLLARPVVRELREQAAALRAIAVCDAGGARATRSESAQFEGWQESAFEARVRAACER